MSVASILALPWPRDVLDEFGIYVHVPFCSHRCWYCDFNAYAGLDHLTGDYMRALVTDVRHAVSAPPDADLDDRPTVTSIFIGGGTPSLVPAADISAMLEAIRDSWPLHATAEVTIECNPDSIDDAKLADYLESGVNRISFGVQSLNDGLLARLGRTHDAARALEGLRAARRAGFDDVSADLIFGIPGEDDASWRASLDGVLECGPDHLSCYALIYEEGTPLESWRRLGKVTPVHDDDVAERWHHADAVLTSAGFERYEISNWARPGSRSRHNSLYWACGEYLGVGAGAHSHLSTKHGALRSWNVRAPERYAELASDGASTVRGTETIDERTRASEVMILGLRRPDGVAMEAFSELVGRDMQDVYGAELERGTAAGILSMTEASVVCTQPFLVNEAAVLFA